MLSALKGTVSPDECTHVEDFGGSTDVRAMGWEWAASTVSGRRRWAVGGRDQEEEPYRLAAL